MVRNVRVYYSQCFSLDRFKQVTEIYVKPRPHRGGVFEYRSYYATVHLYQVSLTQPTLFDTLRPKSLLLTLLYM